jgi:hypothetical protein
MNIRNTFLAAIAFIGISATAVSASEDFDTFQLDTQVSVGDFSAEYRKVINSDYDHVELGYSPINRLTVSFRYAETGGETEYRGRMTYTLVENFHGFYLKPRIEYRGFENSTDYFRFRPIVGYQTSLSTNTKAFVEFTPHFCFGSGQKGFNFCKTKTELGVKIGVLDRVDIVPFVRLDTDDKFNQNNFIGGTKIAIRL